MIKKIFIILAALMSFLIAAQASTAPSKAGIVALAATGTTTVTFTAPASNGG